MTLGERAAAWCKTRADEGVELELEDVQSLLNQFEAVRAEALAHVRDALTRDQVERIVYDIAQKMAERGLFVRDDFGEPSIHAIKGLSAGLADALDGLLDAAGT